MPHTPRNPNDPNPDYADAQGTNESLRPPIDYSDLDSSDLTDAAESTRSEGPNPRAASRLGLLALLLGVSGCVLCRLSMFPANRWLNPVLPAAAGAVLALLALLARLIGSRTRAGIPLLGLLVSLAALGIAGYEAGVRDVNTGRSWAGGQVAQIKQLLPKSTAPPAGPAKSSGTPNPGSPVTPGEPPVAGTAPGASPSGGAGQPNAPDDGVGAGTIFDMKHGAGSSGATRAPGAANAPAAPAVPNPTNATPSNVVPPPTAALGAAGRVARTPASADPRVQTALGALQAAQARVRTAENAFRTAYAGANHPEYVAAQSEVKSADELVADAKLRSDGFGAPLIDATEKRKQAQEKVSRIVNAAMAQDPAVVSARAELSNAETNLRGAYEQAGKSR